jgi:hypothetical protein
VTLPFRRTTTAALPRAAAVVAVLAGSTVAAGVTAARSAHAADTICVALVVDFGDLGAGVDSDCVTVPDGSSGEDVLRARHTLGFRPNQPGFVCTIDGWPHEGCSASNGEHYWAYFHRAPGSSAWTYSTAGASGYQPRNSSTEGWVWLTRKDQTPADVAFSSICKTTASPTPKPTSSSPSSGDGGGSGSGSGGGSSGSGSTSGKSQAATGSSTTSADTSSDSGPATRADPDPTTTRTRSPIQPGPPDELPTTPPSATTTADAVAAPDADDDDGTPPYGLLAGVVVVGGVGTAAVMRARRNRGES